MKKKQAIASIVKLMKLTFAQIALAVLFTCSVYANDANGQDYLNKPVSINVKQVEIKKVIAALESQVNVKFVYSPKAIQANRKLSCSIANKKLSDFLNDVFKALDIGYSATDDQIILFDSSPKKQVIAAVVMENTSAEPMNSSIDFTISGTVKDDNGNTLAGVTVTIQGTNNRVFTNEKGDFKISVKNENAVLVFSSVGYLSTELAVGNKKTNIEIVLKLSNKDLDDVVVIGYGTQKKKDLTGSVASVSIADLNKAPVKSFDDALAGRVSGVQVTSPDGQPGASPNIIIRGGNSVTQDNSPLYVVDGFPIENYNNNAISPADIESIEVLKDASSTAIYGARGANGVIMITTKKGKTGPSVVSYNTFYGWQSNTKTMELMDPYNFVKLQYEIDSVRTIATYFINGKGLESYRNTASLDWQKQVFRTAPMQSHNLSVRGGNKDTKYSISGSMLKQDGTIIASGFKRYQGRVTLDQNINTKFKVGVNVNYSNISTTGLQVGGSTQTANNFLINVWQYRPLNASGNLDSLLNAAQDADVISSTNYQWNPILTAQNEIRNRTTKLLTVNSYLDYAILPSLKLRISAGLNTSNLRYDVFNTSQSRLGSPVSSLGSGGPNGSSTFTELNNYVNENTLTYSKVFNKIHAVNAVTGFTTQTNTSAVSGAGAILVPNESLGVAGLGQGTPFNITSTKSKNTLASFLARVNYSYKSKYLATFAFRTDGSSKFVGDNKWGYFPSGALAWHISEENFLKNSKVISDAKLRGSYGIIGNNRVTDFASFGLITQGGGDSYAPGGQYISGAYASSLSNPNLRWESTAETDLGLDLGFFDQRLTLSADAYNKKTTNLLLNAQLPTSTGYATAFENIGTVQNRGIEISVASTNVNSKNFRWTSSFNIAFNKTKLLALAQNQQLLLSNAKYANTGVALTPNYIAQIGQPVAMFFGYQWIGNYQYSDFDQNTPGVYTLKTGVPNNGNPRSGIQPGDIKYQDINGDGVVDDKDREIIGNPNPKFIGGLSNNFTWHNFDLNIFFQFVYGNEILNLNKLFLEGNIANLYGSNQYASYINRWSPTNPTNENYRALGYGPAVYSSRVIEDGSFLRLKTVNLGYSVSPLFLKRTKIKSLHFYVSGQNLITWTKYSGLDPEVNNYNTALTPGMDYSAYPRSKVITVGLDVSF